MDEDSQINRNSSAALMVRFGPYVLDLRSAELQKNDFRIRLQDQPFQILVALLQRPGEVVLRDEIRRKLWPDETVVEFDHSINAAVKRLRDALLDSAEKPRYVETLARRGYRFIGEVKTVSGDPAPLPTEKEPLPLSAPLEPRYSNPVAEPEPTTLSDGPREDSSPKWVHQRRLILAACAAITLIVGGIAFNSKRSLTIRNGQITRLTFDSGLTTEPAVSPDGKLLAYASDRHGSGTLHIWVEQFMPDGQAVQLTYGDVDDHEPAFSPDGSKLAFRSERDGGGIYMIPAIGGEATLIAKGGRDPRFSPDGRWIAYWQADMVAAPLYANAGAVYLVPSAGGTPQPVRSDLTEAGVPVWSPDSAELIVYGRKNDLPPTQGDWDWWVLPARGGTAKSTGAFGWLRGSGFLSDPREAPRVAEWRRDELVFYGRVGDSTNVWKIHIDRFSRVTGSPHRLTSGTGFDAYPSVTPDGRLLFAGMTNSIDVWTVPIDANDATAVGQLKRVTEAVGPNLYPSLTEDGKLLAYSSVRQGHAHVWIKNLESGKEAPAVTHRESEGVGPLSPDGSLLTYLSGGSSAGGFVVPVQGGTTRQFCTGGDCSPYSISRDNKVVLYRSGHFLRAFSLDSGQDDLFLGSANYQLYQSVFSPDQRWVLFEAVHHRRSRLYVAAVREWMPSLSEKDWIPLTADEGWTDKPRWSPDGKLIYFISNRDGFFCLWAQHLASDTKRAEGPPVPITHFHGSRLSIDNVGPGSRMEISVARDKIALNLGELTGNVWVTDLSR